MLTEVKIIFFIAIFMITYASDACAEIPSWYQGSLVLTTNEVKQGKISIQPAYDLVLFKSGEELMVYQAHKINALFYYDEKANINRKFISLEQHHTIALKSYRLFEIVLMGDVRVLRRIISATVDPKDDAGAYQYYLQHGEILLELHKFRNKLYPKLVSSSSILLNFIEMNKLNPSNAADIIRIVEFYNKTRNSMDVVASNL
jgi:hypothetical protein